MYLITISRSIFDELAQNTMNLCSTLSPMVCFNPEWRHTSESLIALKDAGQKAGLSAML